MSSSDVPPVQAKHDPIHRRFAHAEFGGEFGLKMALGDPPPDVHDVGCRKSVCVMPVAPVVLAVPNPVSKILFSRAISEIAERSVSLAARAVQSFHAGWARANESQKNQLVNEESPALARTMEKDLGIAATARTDIGLQHPALVPPRTSAGEHRPGQAANPPMVTYFVPSRIPRDGPPSFGGRISHSRTSFAVRPGRCVRARDRAAYCPSYAGDLG
jgi:hypothetical protein